MILVSEYVVLVNNSRAVFKDLVGEWGQQPVRSKMLIQDFNTLSHFPQ